MEGDKINVKKHSVSPKSLLIHLYFLVIVRSFVFAKLYHVAKTFREEQSILYANVFLEVNSRKNFARKKKYLVSSVYVTLIQAYTYMEVRGVLAMVWGVFLVKGNHRAAFSGDATLLFPFLHLTSIGASS